MAIKKPKIRQPLPPVQPPVGPLELPEEELPPEEKLPIEEELPIEEVEPIVEELELTPPSEEDLFSSLANLYPRMFEPELGISEEEMPGAVWQTIQTWANENPDEFLQDIYSKGHTIETEDLLVALAPGITNKDIEVFFAPEVLEIPEEGIKFPLDVQIKGVEVRKLATLLPDYTVWVEGEGIGVYDPETGQIALRAVADITEAAWQAYEETPWGAGFAPWDEAVDGFPGPIDLLRWIAPTKAGAALGLVGSYWQKYISRPWETFILETRITCQKFYGLETKADNRALDKLEAARDKYGWAMYFSPEVSNIYEGYIEESPLPVEIALRVSEWCHPIYWLPVGKGAGVIARYTSRIPVIGRITRLTAAAVTKAEIAVAYPIAKPMEIAYRKTFGVAIKSSLRRWGASRGMTFSTATQNRIAEVMLTHISPEKLTKMTIKDLFTKQGIATKATQAASAYAEGQAIKYFPLLTASSQAVTGAAPATSTAIVVVTEKIISANIPSISITAKLIDSLIPKGVTLEKTASLTAQLGEMGYSADVIAGMSSSDAWANLFKNVAPEVTVPPPKVPSVDISGMTDGEAAKIIAASDHLLIDIPSQTDIINSALQSNWGKTLAETISKIPAGKEIIKIIDPRELVGMDAATMEAIVARNAIGFTEVVKMGQNAAAVKLGELQGITTNPVKLFGFTDNAYSGKMVNRLLPEYKGTIEAGTLEHIFTHPEMYNWKGLEKGLKYVRTVHEINTEVFALLKKEGVAPNLSEEAMREWWIHRVVEGRYDADGELIAIRGRPGMRGVIAAKRGYEMHRKAPTMYEGMSWHIKYAENPEVSVRTYIEDTFTKIAQERFYLGTEEALEAIGKAGVKPSDILKELYPDIVGRFELAASELKAAANFHSVINRAIRGERIPEQTLRAIERRFPELGRRLRALVKEPVQAEKQLRGLLAQNEKLIRSLRAKLERAEAIDIEAIKAEARTDAIARGIPDEQKIIEAFRIMDYEDRLAFRTTLDTQMDDIGRMLAEEEVELAGIREFLKTDPVATYHGIVRGKRVPLTSVLVKGQFPESFTVAQAKMLMMGKTPKTIIKGRVPRSVVIDELADHFKMGEQQLIDHIEYIAAQRVTAKDLGTLVTFGGNRQSSIKRMLEILDRVDTAPEFIPKAAAGMPEAGMQQDIFGYQTPVFPRGKGEVTQISMDDYNKLVEYHKQQGLPPPDVGVRPAVEGIKGLKPEKVVLPRQLSLRQIARLETRFPIAKLWVDEKAYLDKLTAEIKAKGITEPVTIKVREDGSLIVWDGIHRLAVAQKLGIEEIPVKFIGEIDKFLAVEAGAQIKQVTYDIPPLKTTAERKAALEALRKEVKELTEVKKIPYWKAMAERAATMELVRQPPIGEGYIMQSHFAGKIYDQEFIDAVNKFFGHKSGLRILKPIADLSGILTTAKAALDVSFPAIQGLPAFGLAHSYFLTNPKVGAKLLGAWFKAFLYPVRAYLQPEWMHRIVAKNEAEALQRISFGGSSMSIDYFRALRARGGLGGFAASIMHKIPFSPYERAELAFYGAGEIIRNEFWKILKGDAIRQGSEFNLAQALDRMTGLISTEKMGITLTQRQLERSFMFFAPQYTRACLTFLGNVFRGGYTGGFARKALMGLIAAGAVYYAGVQYAIATLEGKDHDEAWDAVTEGFGVVEDPITGEVEWKPSARFMTFRVGNYNFGVGGFWYGLVRLAGNISACVDEVGEREVIDLVRIFKDGSFNKRDNPLLYWWWCRSSMVTHAIDELGTGTDFLGYPIETPWEYARHIISMLQPIWVEQGVNWMIPGMARDNEIPEDAARASIIPAELFGLRTFPESQWVRFYDKASEYITHIPEDELDERQIEAWQEGKLEWKHLTDIQQINLLSRYPDLNEIYTEAQADSAVRDSDRWKQWQGRTDEERTVYYDRGTNLVDRLQRGDLDTREFREMWSEAGQNYGIALDTIEKEPTYSEIYDYFDKVQSERGEKYGFMDDLALGEYVEIMFTDYLDDKGDYAWDAKDRAVDEYIERWGEDTYERIRQMYADKKLLEGVPPTLIRLSDDKDKLGREYWQLPYKPIKGMDEDDEVEGNIPAEYYALWKRYQALETDAEREAFIEAHPDLAKDWRAEYRVNNPEADAMLAFWGYGGKLQSMEAYNLVVKWGQELGIPLEQMGLGLPPQSLIEDYFELNKVVAETSGSSIEARIFKLEHPEYLTWGLEQGIWADDLSDESIEALRLRVQYKPEQVEYDAIPAEDRDARKDFMLKHTEFRDARRRIEVYNTGVVDVMIAEANVEYGVKTDQYGANSAEALLFRYDNPELNAWGMSEEYQGENTWQPLDESRVPIWRINAQYRKEDKEYNAIQLDDAIKQREAREAYLAEHSEYAIARRRRDALEIDFPEIENYVAYYELDSKGFRQERMLLDNPDFAKAMHTIAGIDLPEAGKVPAVQYDDIYDQYSELFDKLDGLGDHQSPYYIEDVDRREMVRQAMRIDKKGNLTEFGVVEIRRNGYGKLVPEKHIESYVGYYSIIAEGKPKDWDEELGWYKDDWFMMEHQDFYKEVYIGILGNERKDFSKVPTKKVFEKYQHYLDLPKGKRRLDYRYENPRLDAWLVLKFGYVSAIEQKRRTELTPTEKFLEDVLEKETEFDEAMRELDKLLAALRE